MKFQHFYQTDGWNITTRPSFPKALTLTSLFRSYGLGEQWSRALGKLRKLHFWERQKKLEIQRRFGGAFLCSIKEYQVFVYPRWYCKLPPNWRTLLRWFHDDRNTTLNFAGERICRGIIDNCDTSSRLFDPEKSINPKFHNLPCNRWLCCFGLD